MVVVKPASIHTTDWSRRKKREWMEEIQELNVSSWALKKSRDVGGDFRLRRCSVGPVWLSAASRSASTHTASTVLLTPGGT